MEINNLIIEVTRICNMKCVHCLRGTAENKTMKKEYIDSLLNQITNISNVTFSGGEPSLNVEIMEYFLSVAKAKKINIGSFYIATNGKHVSESFVIFCLKMFSYCEEKEMCLIIKTTTKKVKAKKDIVVYKTLIQESDGEYLTSYQFFIVKIGETYTSDLIRDNNEICVGLHSFVSKSKAKRVANYYNELAVKCVIPKGSYYYRGSFFRASSIASDTLTYVEII